MSASEAYRVSRINSIAGESWVKREGVAEEMEEMEVEEEGVWWCRDRDGRESRAGGDNRGSDSNDGR